MVVNFASFVHTTLLNKILATSMSAVGVATSPGKFVGLGLDRDQHETRPRISVETQVSFREGQIRNHSIPIHKMYVRNRATHTYV